MSKIIKVLYFATVREAVNRREELIELPDASCVSDLKVKLLSKYPEIVRVMTTVLVSVNQEFAFDADLIPEGAEIALFPPVSGGSTVDYPTLCSITDHEVDINKIVAEVTLPSTGAVAIFTGTVRAITTRDKVWETKQLEYEAYQPMAEAKMHQIAAEIRTRWSSVDGIAIVQRVGIMTPGTPTIVVACSAAHRDTGVFDAARYGIDRLKEIVPVWKKEVGPGGEEWVEGLSIQVTGE